jgi:hypothetical protein
VPNAPALRTRKPTGAVPWPFILLEGEEFAGKTYEAARLSASEKVGRTLWLDLGEGSADEYGAIPGARYEILEHDGTYAQVLNAVLAAKAEAARAAAAGEPPVVLVIDTWTDLWDGLKDWASDRAKGSASNRKRLAEDPSAEIKVSSNLWNDAGARHKRIMTPVLTFPGIVIGTARGKQVAEIGANGAPIEGSKIWKVEGHKNLAYDATAWVRMTRTSGALLVGSRSLRHGIRPGKDDPKPLPDDWSLEWLIFDALGCDPASAHVREIHAVTGGALLPSEVAGDPQGDIAEQALEVRDAVEAAWDELLALRAIFDAAKDRKGLLDQIVPGFDADAGEVALGALIMARGKALQAAEKATAEAARQAAEEARNEPAPAP